MRNRALPILYVVPTMLDDLEQHGSDYEARVRLADAARNAWAARINDYRNNATNEEGPQHD